MDRVHNILNVKGTKVHTIPSTASVLDAMKLMDRFQIGCLLVVEEDGALCGLIAERDIVRSLVQQYDQDFSALPVSNVMTKEVIVCKSSDQIDAVRNLMKTKWVRQVPVVDDDGRLHGIISIGDVSAYMIQEEEIEINYLHDYIEGRVR